MTRILRLPICRAYRTGCLQAVTRFQALFAFHAAVQGGRFSGRRLRERAAEEFIHRRGCQLFSIKLPWLLAAARDDLKALWRCFHPHLLRSSKPQILLD